MCKECEEKEMEEKFESLDVDPHKVTVSGHGPVSEIAIGTFKFQVTEDELIDLANAINLHLYGVDVSEGLDSLDIVDFDVIEIPLDALLPNPPDKLTLRAYEEPAA